MAVDIGGTFTDIVLDRGAERITRKVLTTAQRPEEGVLDGARLVLGDAGLHFSDIDVFIHGTTLATNAIIERRGARTALIATDGFRDVLDIANESRYDQYDLTIEKPQPLVPRSLRFTVPERVDVNGKVRLALDEAAVAARVSALRDAGIEAVAICFMHSYANPAHEERTAAILKKAMPGLSITLSSEVCPEIREYERTSTAVANAYVQPLIDGYLARMDEALRVEQFRGAIYLVTSGGGLTSIDTARKFPVRLIESGPAGGAIFASQIAARAGEKKVLSFDMGGTTAKICLIEDFEPNSARVYEVDRAARFLKGSGLPVRIPVIEMVEIGAGGGSIAKVDALEARHGRAGKRGLGARARLLPARRHAADRHRCGCGAWHDRSGGVRGRHDLAQSGSVARRIGDCGRRSAGSKPRDRRLRGARNGRARTWRAPRACMRSSAARW